jgi:hypothetical protein
MARLEPGPDADSLWVIAEVTAGTPAALERLFEVAAEALQGRGLALADVVRARMFASTREVRDAASVVRFRWLRGPARCATSSYLLPARFPTGEGASIELLALAGASGAKVVGEYEPLQGPCRFVATRGRVFFSGLTSTHQTLARQLEHIGRRLHENRAAAARRLDRPGTPLRAGCYVHRSLDRDIATALAGIVGLPAGAIGIHPVDGFSTPGKLLELEVDDALGDAPAA